MLYLLCCCDSIIGLKIVCITFRIENMKKMIPFFTREMRPAAIMLLCSCITFSAVSPYIPAVGQTADLTASNSAGEETTASAVQLPEEAIEADCASAEAQETAVRQEYVPAPYRLNLAYRYPEESDESYAEILMKELIRKDAQWYAEIYDMAATAPARMAPRLGRQVSTVMGQYNPASRTQNKNDPSTWAVEHFKNVKISFYNGDGEITSAVSNAQEILAMASVYAYYNDIEDIDEIRNYINKLWQISHSYSVSMGDVYYCDGCVSTDQSGSSGELEDSELEGEDFFNVNSTIDTEITVTQDGSMAGVIGENGETISNLEGFENEADSSTGRQTEKTAPQSTVHENGIVIVPDSTTPAHSNHQERETTKSALESLAETAESVYIEETKPRVVIVREKETTTRVSPGQDTTADRDLESTGAEVEAPPVAETLEEPASETLPSNEAESVAALETREGLEEGIDDSILSAALSMKVQIVPTSSEQKNATKAVIRPGAPTEKATAETTDSGAEASALEESSQEAASQESVSEQRETSEAVSEQESSTHAEETKQETAAPETAAQADLPSKPSSAGSSKPAAEMVCPGHIDLKITAKIYTLSGSSSLYALDQIGNSVKESSPWPGWTDRTMAFVSHIDRQDWVATYDLNITVEGTSAPLSDTEIETYMKLLPSDTSETRKDIIRFALQSVGKVPYYWGGKPSAQNYSGNNFGAVTIPDHRGRILKGLDCSGWINWVYWSAANTRLAYEGTDGLRTLGRQVNRQELKPGDIIVITGSTPHVIMFLSWAPNGQIQCIHESGSANNVTVGTMTANWPYYRNLLD